MTEQFDSLLARSIQIIHSSKTAARLFRHLISFLKQATNIRCIQLIVVDPASGDLQVKAYAYISGLPMYDIAHKDGVIDSAVQKNEYICINTVSKDLVYDEYDDEVRSELAIPIAKNDQVYGVLNFEHDKEDFFSNDLVEALGAVAEAVSEKLPLLQDRFALEKESIV